MHLQNQAQDRRIGRVVGAAALLFGTLAALSVLKWHTADYGLVHLINGAAQQSVALDHLFGNLSRLMLSNLMIVSVLWAAWFQSESLRDRAVLLTGVLSSAAASVISRGLQLALPSHPRPLHDFALGFRLPLAVNPEGLNHWGSFPSDHAALFFGIAMTILLVNKRLGMLAMLIAVVINFARIYLGFHYPSDVLGGAALGILLVTLSYPLSFRRVPLHVMDWSERHRPLFYGLAFYASFGIVTLMQDYRDLASGLMHHLRHHVG